MDIRRDITMSRKKQKEMIGGFIPEAVNQPRLRSRCVHHELSFHHT
jgi:hypothetical protein